jgi:branched-subunit amino acid ABC-type transport system permease component
MEFSLDLLFEAVVFGVLLGCFYAAVSIGLSVSFGLLDVPHVAHPALIVFGSYCTWLVAGQGLDPIVAGVVLMPASSSSGSRSTASTTRPSRNAGPTRACAGSRFSSASR